MKGREGDGGKWLNFLSAPHSLCVYFIIHLTFIHIVLYFQTNVTSRAY